jgi:uncharacterized GH25 family protein
MNRIIPSILALLIGCRLAYAHDLWLIPPVKAEAGKKTTIEANVGMDFPKSESPPDTAKFKRRFVLGPDGKESELAAAGKGRLDFEPKKNGLHILAVETHPKIITLDADAFNAYLVADGMPHIYRLRVKDNTLHMPGKERYSKYVKTLVQVEADGGGDASRVLGMLLEIVPLRDPFKVKTGETLPVRVLFQGKPLAEANLGWQHPGDGETARGYVRTDDKGEAPVPVAKSGLMTIRLTHMTRPKTKDYEWESFWSTLTFRVP